MGTSVFKIHCFSAVISKDKLKEYNIVQPCKTDTANLQKGLLLPTTVWNHLATFQGNILAIKACKEFH